MGSPPPTPITSIRHAVAHAQKETGRGARGPKMPLPGGTVRFSLGSGDTMPWMPSDTDSTAQESWRMVSPGVCVVTCDRILLTAWHLPPPFASWLVWLFFLLSPSPPSLSSCPSLPNPLHLAQTQTSSWPAGGLPTPLLDLDGTILLPRRRSTLLAPPLGIHPSVLNPPAALLAKTRQTGVKKRKRW